MNVAGKSCSEFEKRRYMAHKRVGLDWTGLALKGVYLKFVS
jgi:hypothetical protein